MPDIYSHTGDAGLRMDNETTFAGARNAATAETISTTAVKNNSAVKVAANSGENQYDVYRAFLAFDTSAITVQPESATLKLYGFTFGDADLIIIKANAGATGDSSTDFVAADFNQTSSTAYSEQVSSWSTSGYNEITLKANALADMASLDEFKIVVVEHDFDYSNTTPPGGTTVRSGFYFANEGGTDKDPKISYVAGTANTTISESEPVTLIADDFTINSVGIDCLSVQHERETQQVPFTLGVPGPLSLRKRGNAPSAKQGDKKN